MFADNFSDNRYMGLNLHNVHLSRSHSEGLRKDTATLNPIFHEPEISLTYCYGSWGGLPLSPNSPEYF